MRIFGDYHTHTIFSRNNHGKSTIEENVISAKEKGLKEIAITDHGLNHRFYGARRKNLAFMREECDRLSEKYGIKVLLGLETNLLSKNGDIDLTKEDRKFLDIVLMGYHNAVKPYKFKDNFFLLNSKIFHTQKQIQKNTDAYLKSIEKNDINIITHLNYGVPVFTKQVAKFANEKGTLIELNGKRIFFSEQDIEDLLSLNTKFIINSDAHHKKDVGETNLGLNFVIKNNIPFENVVNLDKVPNFKLNK